MFASHRTAAVFAVNKYFACILGENMSKMNIRGSEKPIGKIFGEDAIFTIPLYQRPYAWTTEQSEELLQDLLRAMRGGEEPIDDLPPYFLGSVVLIEDEELDAKVVDGQQRLTTITMLLAVLRSLINSENADALTDFLCEKGNLIKGIPKRYRLRPRKQDAQFFEKYIQDDGGIEELKALQGAQLSESQGNIRDNTVAFVRELQTLSEKQLISLSQFIINRCFMIVVSVSSLDLNWYYAFSQTLNVSSYAFVICRVPPYRRKDRYFEILKAIHDGKDLYTPNSPLQLSSRERQEFYRLLNGDIYLASQACQYVLLRLDTRLSEGTASYEFETVSIEHVLPQGPSPDSNWVKAFPTKEIREKYVHRLGNLVLLSRSRNMKAENYDFIDKKQKYFTTRAGISPFVLTTQVLRYQEWTPAVIEQRQNQLMSTLRDLWRL
jgi:hypothetical protein